MYLVETTHDPARSIKELQLKEGTDLALDFVMVLNHQAVPIIILLVLMLLVISPSVTAQQVTGTITGNVKDSSGAVLPGAEVTATNTATRVDSVVVVNDEGLYRIPNLPPSIYDLTAGLPGFKTAVVSGIEVRVGAVVRRDVTLDVGQIAEQVTVEANRNVVESEEPSLGAIVSGKEILELPSGEKNFMTLATLPPGWFPSCPRANSVRSMRTGIIYR